MQKTKHSKFEKSEEEKLPYGFHLRPRVLSSPFYVSRVNDISFGETKRQLEVPKTIVEKEVRGRTSIGIFEEV